MDPALTCTGVLPDVRRPADAASPAALLHLTPERLSPGEQLLPGSALGRTLTHCSDGRYVTFTDDEHVQRWAGYLADRAPTLRLYVYAATPLGPIHRVPDRRGIPSWPVWRADAATVQACLAEIAPWEGRPAHAWAQRVAIPF